MRNVIANIHRRTVRFLLDREIFDLDMVEMGGRNYVRLVWPLGSRRLILSEQLHWLER